MESVAVMRYMGWSWHDLMATPSSVAGLVRAVMDHEQQAREDAAARS